MPPDHPFPAALDDCLATYRALLQERPPDQIIVGGASAGGNLTAALVLRARDEGLPLPAAVALFTPAVDLTEAGDSHQTNLGLDPLLPGSARPAFLLYAAGHDLTHPYLSPLNGDFTKGFPPTILTTGTRDMLLSDTVRMHRALRAAGIAAELHVTEAAGHGGFMGMAPEDEEILREVRRFADTHWRSFAAKSQFSLLWSVIVLMRTVTDHNKFARVGMCPDCRVWASAFAGPGVRRRLGNRWEAGQQVRDTRDQRGRGW
jgi:acetyl esterase/lipase